MYKLFRHKGKSSFLFGSKLMNEICSFDLTFYTKDIVNPLQIEKFWRTELRRK
jgi:hypothetical protein